eukprot:2795290-Amphidinium_carterae.1
MSAQQVLRSSSATTIIGLSTTASTSAGCPVRSRGALGTCEEIKSTTVISHQAISTLQRQHMGSGDQQYCHYTLLSTKDAVKEKRHNHLQTFMIITIEWLGSSFHQVRELT